MKTSPIRAPIRGPIKKHRPACGFTLLEMLVVMLVLSLLASGYYGPQLLSETRRIKRTQADVIAQEIGLLGAAAQEHTLSHAGAWPRETDNCHEAQLSLTDRLPDGAFSRDTAFYRGATSAAPAELPFVVASEEAHLGRYYFDCSENTAGDRALFRVRLMLGDDVTRWAEYIANQLPNSEVSGDSVRGLEVGWPPPSALPAFDAFVSKSEPVFENNLNVNGNSIFGADEVILNTGQSLASAVQYAGLARPNNYVAKPNCPPGLTPQIITVPVEIGHLETQPITYFRTYATETGNGWRISTRVHGRDSEAINTRARVGVFTVCS